MKRQSRTKNYTETEYYNKNGWNIYYEQLSEKYNQMFLELDKKILKKDVDNWDEHQEKLVINDGKQRINLQSDHSLLYCCGTMGNNYEYVLDYCLKNEINSIVDIGSAFAWQSDMFLLNEINYYTINHFIDDTMRNLDKDKYFEGTFPSVDHDISKDTLAVAILSIGWNVYTKSDKQLIEDFKGLAEQFNKALVYIPLNIYNKIKHLFNESRQLQRNFYELIS